MLCSCYRECYRAGGCWDDWDLDDDEDSGGGMKVYAVFVFVPLGVSSFFFCEELQMLIWEFHKASNHTALLKINICLIMMKIKIEKNLMILK